VDRMRLTAGLGVTASLVALIACQGRVSPSTTPPVTSSPTEIVDAIPGDGVRCAGSEGPGTSIIDMAPDEPGGPSEPEEALRKDLTDVGLRIDMSEVQRASSSGRLVRFVVAREGRRVFLARVEMRGDSWHLTLFRGCTPFIDELRAG
jgi:hypothetical protein